MPAGKPQGSHRKDSDFYKKCYRKGHQPKKCTKCSGWMCINCGGKDSALLNSEKVQEWHQKRRGSMHLWYLCFCMTMGAPSYYNFGRRGPGPSKPQSPPKGWRHVG